MRAQSHALCFLSEIMSRYYGKKAIMLIDEYDTSLNEAYVDGYWNELSGLLRSCCGGPTEE